MAILHWQYHNSTKILLETTLQILEFIILNLNTNILQYVHYIINVM